MTVHELVEALDNLELNGGCEDVALALVAQSKLAAKIAGGVHAIDKSGEWELEGAASLVAWVRNNGTMTGGEAQAVATTATVTASLPVTRAAWEAGELSTAQVRAICASTGAKRLATFAEHEADVVPTLAPLSALQTINVMALWRARWDAQHDDEAEPDNRKVLWLSKTFGGWHELKGGFDNDDGQVVAKALELATTRDGETEERTPAQRRADPLLDICGFFLDHQKIKTAGRHRPHLNLVVDAADLDEPGRYIDGSVAAASVIQSLLCDANVHCTLTNGRRAILDYGRSVRTAPPDLFNALALRDGHCREPGCDRPPEWCEAHHVVMWEDGGVTSIDNSVLRCSRHHHLLHKRRKLGWIEPSNRTALWSSPILRDAPSRPKSMDHSRNAHWRRVSRATAICRCARGARIPASSRADAGPPPTPPGSGECGVPGSSPAWHLRPNR